MHRKYVSLLVGLVLLLGIVCYTVILGRMDRMAPPPVPA